MKKYNDNIEIPKTLINLKYLMINNIDIKKIPKTLINLEELYLSCSYNLNKIPKTLINLQNLEINISYDDYFNNWEECDDFIKYIPNTLKKLKSIKISTEQGYIKDFSNFENLENLEIKYIRCPIQKIILPKTSKNIKINLSYIDYNGDEQVNLSLNSNNNSYSLDCLHKYKNYDDDNYKFRIN